VEVPEYFSWPQILELTAQCELARYRGAAPDRLQCPYKPWKSKSFQDIFVEGVTKRFLCNNPDTQSAVFRHYSWHHFHILIIC